jgi:hypothetical protein
MKTTKEKQLKNDNFEVLDMLHLSKVKGGGNSGGDNGNGGDQDDLIGGTNKPKPPQRP